MLKRPRITILAFVSSSPREQARGLLGWLSIDVDGLLVLDGVALRRTRQGQLALAFPAPKSARRRRRVPVRPSDDAARRAIQTAVLEALDSQEGIR